MKKKHAQTINTEHMARNHFENIYWNTDLFANLRGNPDTFWTVEMNKVQSVSLSPGIYLQDK